MKQNHTKAYKKIFIETSSNPQWLKKMKRTDPIQFNILYNEWKRKRKG